MSLSRELFFLVLQYLKDHNFNRAMHMLEQESGNYFDMKYFEDKVLAGEWDVVEDYLSGFTKVDDNEFSTNMFFEIGKQKFLEVLDRRDIAKANEILKKDLSVFLVLKREPYLELFRLLTLDNFRENQQFSNYGDMKSARTIMLVEIKKIIIENPLLREKLAFPTIKASRLKTLINQSLNWQHHRCKNPRPNPDMKTLFTNHTCSPENIAHTATLPVAAVSTPSNDPPPRSHAGPVPPPPSPAAANANELAGSMTSAYPSVSVQPTVLPAQPLLDSPNQAAALKRPRTPSSTAEQMDYQSGEADHPMKHMRIAESADEIMNRAPQSASGSVDDLPRHVACSMHQGSAVTSMDFHPSHHTLLAVGSSNGEIALWEAGKQEKLVSKPFEDSVDEDSSISVSRIAWSPDGTLLGVAFSEHLVQLYAYQRSTDLMHHIEIDAHVGRVNDLAFAHPYKQLCVITCGDDKLIKVWDLTGRKLASFEGHESPVYSVCPHQKQNIHFIFSTDVNGNLKAWLYGNVDSGVSYGPDQCCTRMVYSADGRLFSCGTRKDGGSYLVEWDEIQGTITKVYGGLTRKSAGIVQFETARNRFLAAGEDNKILFWDMDNVILLTSTDADGQLPSMPQLRFNKEGNLLAVTTVDDGFKILANAEGLRLIKAAEARYEVSRRNVDVKNLVDQSGSSTEKPKILEDASEKAKRQNIPEIVYPGQCRALTIPDSAHPDSKVVRLLYTNSGDSVLALGSNGVQRLWKWIRNERNPNGKATTYSVPQLWKPSNALIMKNDVPENVDEAVPCITLSKNDSYVTSACGGNISLFNIRTFEIERTFMPPPPSSTFLALHPQDNNIIIIGMEDSTIQIYDMRLDKVQTKLIGHQKRITGLAFSSHLNILVSSGADAQLCFWNTNTWSKRKSIALQLPIGKQPIGDTGVQFHPDQVQLLVFHETQLAIYDASKMEFICQWVLQGVLLASISCAAYSCSGNTLYASFCDGNVGVFNANNLTLTCRIAPSAYISQTSLSKTVWPLVVSAHLQEPHQLAVGLSDGSVIVLEP